MKATGRLKLTPGLRKELALALKKAQSASEDAASFLRGKFGRIRKLSEKPDTSLVTEADRGSEDLILRQLQKAFPHHSFLAEESGFTHRLEPTPRTAKGQSGASLEWVIDPLDGTTNFVHGFPLFCISIGLTVDGAPALGHIHQPLSHQRFWATVGTGAFTNGKRLRVSKTANLKDALLTTGFSTDSSREFETEVRTFANIVRRARAIRRTGSAALDLCFVAGGQFDGFFEKNLKPWDVVAGLTILTEAGGQYSDFMGKNYLPGQPTLLASNGKIHRSLLQTIRVK